MQGLELVFGGLLVQKKFAEGAHGHAAEGLEGGGIVGVENEAGHFVGFGRDDRLVQQFNQREVSQGGLCRHAFALGRSGNAGKLVARFFLVGLGEKLAQIGETIAVPHGHVAVSMAFSGPKGKRELSTPINVVAAQMKCIPVPCKPLEARLI